MPKERRIGGKYYCKTCKGYHGTALDECGELKINVSAKAMSEPKVTEEELRRMAEGALAFIDTLEQLHENRIHTVSYKVRAERIMVKVIAQRILTPEKEKP
jgi:hypothetical protein